ncbi:Glycerophosphodiester phosphodiesterase domain [Trinorchestia longiramus]|nr:Glycerophosphodiester phosphodiesterase domain [Trinorchestia longiramus]
MVYGIVVAVIFGCYVLSSYILFKFPCLLHKRKNVKFVCRHISHRGGAGENYENTMTAFKHAVSLGTEMLELDVHLTRDEQVVVAHDPDLRRTEGRGNIAEMNYSELPQLKESVIVDFMPGCTFSRPSEPDRRIPLLETVFQSFPHTPINIDIKVPNDLLIIKVSELVKRYQREHLTVWGNFSDAITQRCYKENPNICLLISMKRVLLLVVQFYLGLLPFMPLKETHLEIFVPLHLYKLYLLKAPAMDPAEAKRPGSPLHPAVSKFNLG